MSDRNTARIFQEMRDADAMRDDMKQSILARAGEALGQAYEKAGNLYEKGQEIVQDSGLMGGLHDAYRRIFEQGYYGKDLFDGRWHQDNRDNDNGRDTGTIHGKDEAQGGQYDTRAEFYGRDNSQGQDTRETGRDRGREDDLER